MDEATAERTIGEGALKLERAGPDLTAQGEPGPPGNRLPSQAGTEWSIKSIAARLSPGTSSRMSGWLLFWQPR